MTQYQPVLGCICSVNPRMVGLYPKQEKSALKCPSKYLNYSQSAYTALYGTTMASCIPIFGQINIVSVVLSINMSFYTQNPKKAHLPILIHPLQFVSGQLYRHMSKCQESISGEYCVIPCSFCGPIHQKVRKWWLLDTNTDIYPSSCLFEPL